MTVVIDMWWRWLNCLVHFGNLNYRYRLFEIVRCLKLCDVITNDCSGGSNCDDLISLSWSSTMFAFRK